MGSHVAKSWCLGLSLAASLAAITPSLAKDWKTVVIGMEGAYDPWNLTDSSGKIVGFEPDLAMDLCKRAGLECKIIAQDWDGMIPGLKAGKFDVIMDGMSITDDRKKEIDFSKAYAASPGSFLAPKDNPLAKATGRGHAHQSRQGRGRRRRRDQVGAGGAQGQDARRAGLDHPLQFRRPVSQGHRDDQGVQDRRTTAIIDLKSGRLDAVLEDLPTNMATAAKPDAPGLAVVGPQFIGGIFGPVRAWASARATRTSPPNSTRRSRRRSPTGR